MIMKVSVAPSCPILCNPMDYNPASSSVQGVFQARIRVNSLSPGDLPDPEIKPRSLALEADSLLSKPHVIEIQNK